MVECEFVNYYNFFYGTCVLIDTWWNVNIFPYGAITIEETVLIDTWWNVNPKQICLLRMVRLF